MALAEAEARAAQSADPAVRSGITGAARQAAVLALLDGAIMILSALDDEREVLQHVRALIAADADDHETYFHEALELSALARELAHSAERAMDLDAEE
jgi:hypothetical protein